MTEDNQADIKQEIEDNYRFNFVVNVLDGAFFMFGMGFISLQTILPLFVRQLTESKFLISLITAILMFGTTVPQLISARWIEGLERKKKSVLVLGFFQRLPLLLLAIATFKLAPEAKSWLLISFFVFWSVHSIFTGLQGPAWFDLVSKVIPQDRRGSFFGYRTFFSSLLEVSGAVGAGYIINKFNFQASFTILFGLAFITLMISYLAVVFVREPAYPADTQINNFSEYWQQLKWIIKEQVNYRNYLVSAILLQFIGMSSGLFTVAGIERLGLSMEQADNLVGIFTVLLIVSKSLTNIVWGYLGDKCGHKLVMLLANIFNALGVLIAFFAQQELMFYLIFIFTGIALGGTSVSFMPIIADFSSTPEERTIYVGLTNAATGLTVTVISLLGGYLADILNYKVVFGTSFLLLVGGIGFLFLKVDEPRRQEEE